MYDIAAQLCAISSIRNPRESKKYRHGTSNANSRQNQRPEAPPGILYSKIRAFYPVADN